LLPGCLAHARPRKTGNVPRSELEKLIGLSGAALRLRVACLAWDLPPKAAAKKLGMPGRTYRRAVTAVAKSGREPQVDTAARNGQAIRQQAWPDLAGNRRSETQETHPRDCLTNGATLVPPEAGGHKGGRR
jgi:hypothetical protein